MAGTNMVKVSMLWVRLQFQKVLKAITSSLKDGVITSLLKDGVITSFLKDGVITSLLKDGVAFKKIFASLVIVFKQRE